MNSASPDQLTPIPDLEAHFGSVRTPMFGHRTVIWKRHVQAVAGAALVSATVQTVLATSFAAFNASSGEMAVGAQAAAIAIVAITLWCATFLGAFVLLATGFTIARTTLMRFKLNFAAAYMAVGLLLGVIEAIVFGLLKGAMLPRDFIFATAIGALAGWVYWIIAVRKGRAFVDKAWPSRAVATVRQAN